jgi:hypothetical protein
VPWTGVTICRFDSGKIVEAWWSEDALGMLQQVGVIPTAKKIVTVHKVAKSDALQTT